MGFEKQRLTIREAKEKDMVVYLSGLGHEPAKIRNQDYWYHSPLREEKTPSFKVSRRLNRWYDHGLGKGGNLVDFGIAYYGCSVAEFLEKLAGNFSVQRSVYQSENKLIREQRSPIKILEESDLKSYALLRYLEQRKIPLTIAERHCRELRYELNGKAYYGIGFRNDSGGFELRNPYFKASSSPKDITAQKNGAQEVLVFEGFMDFLSFKAMQKSEAGSSHDFLVLNSVALFERARPFMEEHRKIRLYLDRDAAGKNVTQKALSLSERYTDESSLYKNHKDLNDWLVNAAKRQRQQLGRRPR